jgi:hypothetical protein
LHRSCDTGKNRNFIPGPGQTDRCQPEDRLKDETEADAGNDGAEPDIHVAWGH